MDRDSLAKAFAEWHRRFSETPEAFPEEGTESDTEYGDRCAAYLIDLLGSL